MGDDSRLRKKGGRNYAEDDDLNSEEERAPKKKPDRRTKRAVENSDDEEVDEAQKRKPAAKKRKAAHSQDDSGDDGDDDEFEEIVNDELNPFETGQILKVYVEDFMCHKKMTVDFGRHLNFVTGQNGSGKSAIVAAIQLCLGATARTTGRGNSLGGLIREGTDGPAKVRVTLLNEGVDAFKPDKYGKRITVERTIINRNGGGGYKLLNYKNEVISQEKRELDAMLRTFNIYGDNPCCILTQEESKKFIQGSEKDKYEFFLKATGLQRTKEELIRSQENLAVVENDLTALEKKFEGKKEQIAKLKKELQDLTDLDNYADEIRVIGAKLFWLEAYVASSVVEELEKNLEGSNEAVQEATERVSKAEQDSEEIGNLEEINDVISEIQEEQARREDNAEEKRVAAANMSSQIKKVNSAISSLHANKKVNVKQMEDVKNELQELRKKSLESAAEDQRVFLTEIEQFSHNIAAQEERLANAREQKAAAAQTLSEYQNSERVLFQNTNNLKNEVARMEQDHREIASSSNSRVAAFNPKLPKVLNDIKTKRFRGPVVGPVGSFVKIRKGHEVWGLAIERVLSKVLSSFVVTNSEDQRLLKEILRANVCDFQISIIVQSNGDTQPRYNVPAIPDALSVNDTLVIENDLVFNAVIDQCRVDSAILVENEERDLLQYLAKDRGGNDCFRHQHIQRAVCKKDGSTVSFKGGNRASESGSSEGYKRLLSADTAETLANLLEEIHSKKSQLQGMNEQFKDAKSRSTEIQQQVQRLEMQARSAMEEIKRFTNKKSDVESRLEEVRGAAVIDTSALERELESCIQAIETVEGQITEREAFRDGLNTQLKELNSAYREAAGHRDAIVNKLTEQEKRLEKFLANQESKQKELERARADLAKKERQLADLQKISDKKSEERDKLFEVATEKTKDLIKDWDGNPIALEHKDTKKYLDGKLRSLQAKVAHGREQAGLGGKTIAEVADRYQKAKADISQSLENHGKLKTLYKGLEGDTNDRRKKWKTQLRSSEKAVSTQFDFYLQKKGFAGGVNFDHTEKTLHLTCQVDNQDDNTRTKDVRQLSGGERSYTTLCLLMALGHVIECPFRLLDEYDVFLDDVARKVTLEELQSYAQNTIQKGRQFIVITPHNLADVRTSDKVRIRRMAPPERHRAHGLQQQVLPFSGGGN